MEAAVNNNDENGLEETFYENSDIDEGNYPEDDMLSITEYVIL